MSEKYIEMIWGSANKIDKAEQTNAGKGEADVVEDYADNGENETGGAV
jgi:hypothetical protein